MSRGFVDQGPDDTTRLTTFHIRTAQVADLEALQDVFRRASLDNAGDRAMLLVNPDALVLSPASVHEQRTRAVVIDGVIVGFATLRRVDDAFELEDLFVDPRWMRRGIGLALVRDAAATARAKGVSRIGVTANPHARAFYERAGFVSDGTAVTRFGPAPRMRLDPNTAF
jgi:N-acetylglutamate synthase-like GNAT family acetyltransferase